MISIAIANFNGDSFLRDAVASALAQRGVDIEVLIVDDRSTDDSWALAQSMAAAEPRVRCWQSEQNRGPGGARNHALREARGRWFAILDNDDLMHPDRLARLVAEAERSDATMIADDLMVFDEARIVPPDTFLRSGRATEAQWIGLTDYLEETVMFGQTPNLGFLKPLFRIDFLSANRLTYDERLRIAEDDDLVVRALHAGARYRLLPQPLYFYRKHGTSISHRLSGADADRMMAASERLCDAIDDTGPTARALRRRHRALRAARGYSHLREHLLARDIGAAARTAAATPGALLLLRQPASAIVRRFAAHLAPAARPMLAASTVDEKAILFVSRQRLLGATNGSSAYLLALAGAARDAGFVPHLLQPSPVVFGRTPFFRLRPEMRVFETIQIRGSVQAGDWRIALAPRIFLAAARGIAARVLRRLGIGGALATDRKWPPSISMSWSARDLTYVARYGRDRARIAIADYMFQAEALPYLLDPHLRTATVMHDQFSARTAQFADDAPDSVAVLTPEAEADLLGRTDSVIAIQTAEAAFVTSRLPDSEVILAPMAARSVAAAQAGSRYELLFVGSNTAPNIYGLRWFVEEVWPIVRRNARETRLRVAGTVAAGIDSAMPPGIELLGLVDDLAPPYAEAGIVISPLRQGSGLKIKLIEAMAHGKAIVATGTTLQGVEHYADVAVIRADTPAAFADAIAALQRDDDARAALAARALAAASKDFGPHAVYADFRSWLERAAQGASTNRQARMKSISI